MKIFKLFLVFSLLTTQIHTGFAQKEDTAKEAKSLLKRIHFGGGIQFHISGGNTTLGIAPSVIYTFDEKWATGLGVSYLYSRNKLHDLHYHVVGGSVLGLYNPIREIQLSTEFEELYVTHTATTTSYYWMPALYIGAAYTMGQHAAMGVRYDLLYDEDKSFYNSAFTPFFRLYF